MGNVKDMIEEIKNRSSEPQQSSSSKDEIRIMQAMINDREYEVGIYSKEGLVGTFNPAKESRDLISSVMSSAAKIPTNEANELALVYDFKKTEAASLVQISKEFVNTYLETKRKLPLGGRETSDVSLAKKTVEATIRSYPIRIKDEQGNPVTYIDETTGETMMKTETGKVNVAAHDSIKVISPCPAWIKK